ncbi:biopolymer transporter ExbD, partial [Flavobacterium sp. HMWF030]
GKPNRGAIVFIKPSEKSTYGDLVDIIEEMRLANIEAYTIVNEFTPEEEKLLASN